MCHAVGFRHGVVGTIPHRLSQTQGAETQTMAERHVLPLPGPPLGFVVTPIVFRGLCVSRMGVLVSAICLSSHWPGLHGIEMLHAGARCAAAHPAACNTACQTTACYIITALHGVVARALVLLPCRRSAIRPRAVSKLDSLTGPMQQGREHLALRDAANPGH